MGSEFWHLKSRSRVEQALFVLLRRVFWPPFPVTPEGAFSKNGGGMAALDHILWFHGDDHTTVGEGGIPSGKGLIPLTTTWWFSVAAGTMNPPGHMQKEWTPRFLILVARR